MQESVSNPSSNNHVPPPDRHALRFLTRHAHLSSVFGSDWFGVRAESFARFFGTPAFVIMQTAIVIAWIVVNATGIVHFDQYPFILLNLGFSLQAAYAAPLILLAATRQADRDKALSEADAAHREALANASAERQELAARHAALMMQLLEHNTRLTEVTQDLSARIKDLTEQIHERITTEPGKN
ncbi:MAG TPA: DUF1003 domain-containing protein [Terriglobia bacterium]|nr:DUF1003 domain-containing protein [Terriglobia bacterium]